MSPPARPRAPGRGAPWALVLALLPACSDYSFGEADDDTPPADDDSTPPADDDTTAADDDAWSSECGEHEYPAGTVPETSVCNPPSDFSVATEWYDPPWTQQPGAQYLEMTPVVISLTDDNGDGVADSEDVPDIVAVYFESTSLEERGALRAMSGDGTGELWSVVGSNCSPLDQVAAGDLDLDGFPEVVCAGTMTARQVTAYDHTGAVKWATPVLPNLSGNWGTGYWVVPPSLCDLDGDGWTEVLAGRYVFDHEGNPLFELTDPPYPTDNYFGASMCADIDRDGDVEILAGGGVYGTTGDHETTLTSTEGQILTAQLDFDDQAELVTSVDSQVRAFEHDGTPIFSVGYTNTLGYGYQDAATFLIADLDGDGLSEIGVPDANGYKAVDDDGSVLWTSAALGVGVSGSSAHDLDSDGVLEIAYQSAGNFYILSAADGSIRHHVATGTEKTQCEYPPIADVDGDGGAEIVLPHSDNSGNPGLQVLGSADGHWQSTDRWWNEWAYRVTNIGDGGVVPTDPGAPWLEYLSIRQARPDPTGGLADLVGFIDEVCNADCDEGVARVWFQVANQGTGGVLEGPVQVSFYANRDGALAHVLTHQVPDVPDSGELGAGRMVELPRTDVEGATLVMIVDDDGAGGQLFGECDEENNVALWNEAFCVEGD